MEGWGERAIFGKIRFMNYQGCKKKFDIKSFVRRYHPASANAAIAQGQSTLV
jgi:deoxyribodipyrimidine photo-lyase